MAIREPKIEEEVNLPRDFHHLLLILKILKILKKKQVQNEDLHLPQQVRFLVINLFLPMNERLILQLPLLLLPPQSLVDFVALRFQAMEELAVNLMPEYHVLITILQVG